MNNGNRLTALPIYVLDTVHCMVNNFACVKFEVIIAVLVKITAFSDVTSCRRSFTFHG